MSGVRNWWRGVSGVLPYFSCRASGGFGGVALGDDKGGAVFDLLLQAANEEQGEEVEVLWKGIANPAS
jgi:hypothetical protein